MTRRVDLGPEYLHPVLADPWRTWLRRHNIDPAEVLVSCGGFLEADDELRQVRYLTPHRDEDTDRKHTSDRCRPDGLRTEPCTVIAVRQLESPALPFPAPVLAGVTS